MIFKILKDLGYNVDQSTQNYYTNIKYWRQWWEGYVPEFHNYQATQLNRTLKKTKRKLLHMAKKVSEDWASLLLNDKTYVQLDDENAQKFLSGDADEQMGGVLGLSKFWKHGNRTVEKEFALGTACFYLNLVNPKYDGSKLSADSVQIKYIKDAGKIIPLRTVDDEIADVALVSNYSDKGKNYAYLQIFELEDNGRYQISNHYFEVNDTRYAKIDAPNGEVESYTLPCKPFFILRPNIENCIDSDVSLGQSVYANAIDQLLGCDVAYDNLYYDILLGRKKVFISQDAIATTEMQITKDGTPVKVRVPAVGDTIEQSLFISTNPADEAASNSGEKQVIFEEYNPDLRVEDNRNNIQLQLNLLSEKVGLGQYRYRFEVRSMTTATEVKSSNKDLTESVHKQRIEIQEILTEMTRSILILGKEYCGQSYDENTKITIKFDDTMFNDEEAERQRDMTEVSQGLMPKYKYVMKWQGLDEEKAKQWVSECEEDQPDQPYGGVNANLYA